MSKRPPILELRSLTKSFGTFSAVDGIDLDIAEGEFFTIVGPSGSGKTTLIRMLAGMEQASSGDIILSGARINDLPANRRPTCMVFQSLALFPHRTVGENIEFPAPGRWLCAQLTLVSLALRAPCTWVTTTANGTPGLDWARGRCD